MWALEEPVYLLLLIPLPILFYGRHILRNRGGRLSFSFSLWRGGGFVPKQGGIKVLLILTSALFWFGLILLVIALAGPAKVEQKRIFLSQGADLMIVLDQSPSMAAQDTGGISRFDAAKEVIRNFLRSRENDSIGIVSFGSTAALRVPPTQDYPYILSSLDSLNLLELGSGTAIGMGIAVACLHLRGSTAERQAIVLITDGENNAGEILPITAADIAQQLGIRIYSIGIGSQGPVPLEYTDPETGRYYRGTFEGRFDEALLVRLSESTGGRYFSVEDSTALDTVFRTIDAAESLEKRIKIDIVSTPLHRNFIYLGFIFIFLDFLIRKLILKEAL